MTSDTNQFALKARMEKCRKLVSAWLTEATDILERATDDEWQNLALRAGINTPSAESKKLILMMLRERAK